MRKDRQMAIKLDLNLFCGDKIVILFVTVSMWAVGVRKQKPSLWPFSRHVPSLTLALTWDLT